MKNSKKKKKKLLQEPSGYKIFIKKFTYSLYNHHT
jgi:hypothetical protein